MNSRYLLAFLLLLAGSGLQAQVDNPTGGIAIPRSNTTVTPSAPLPAESPFKLSPPKKSNSAFQIGKQQSTFSMYKDDEFVSRGAEFKDRANTSIAPRGESNEAYRGNLDYGVIKTKSPYLVLRARDFGAQDGDRIKVTLNGRIIVSDITLLNSSQNIMITLEEGFNNLQFEALNQGTQGPNTGEFILYDKDDVSLSGAEWNLATGFHGKFVILKEADAETEVNKE